MSFAYWPCKDVWAIHDVSGRVSDGIINKEQNELEHLPLMEVTF